MIIPCPEDIREYIRYPLTGTLVLLNIVVFLMFFSEPRSNHFSESMVVQNEGLVLTGRLYHQYFQGLSAASQQEKPKWVEKIQINNPEQLALLGSYALRDASFVSQAEKMSFLGDEVQIENWKSNLVEFRSEYQEQVLYRFGLSSMISQPLVWITYQFSHSGWPHLFSNLVFLVVVGAAVETLAGSATLVLIYLLGGLMGGAAFLYWEAHGTVPMVGASAAVSALLGFYCLAEPRRRIRYFYFIAPIPGQYGAIYLPTLLILPLFLLIDVANLWSTPAGLGGGVAYAAHLGGALFGLIFALMFRRWGKRAPVLPLGGD